MAREANLKELERRGAEPPMDDGAADEARAADAAAVAAATEWARALMLGGFALRWRTPSPA